MQPVESLRALVAGKKVALIGAGVSHKPCIEQLAALGAELTLCDQKERLEDFGDYAATLTRLGVRLSLGKHYTDGFAGQDIILRTPGYEYFRPELQAARAAGTLVTSEVELFFRFCPCEIVAVTGSDGKTTTTTLIAKMFEAAGRRVFLGGNIGAALLPMLGEVQPQDVAVVELSSFQLISMRCSPTVAVVTNVTPNHLDHHKDMQEYIDAKRNILLWQTPPCRAVLGYENAVSRAMAADCRGEQVWFTRLHTTDNGAFLRAEDDTLCYADAGSGTVTPVLARADVKLRGLHNVENLLAAIAAVWGRVPLAAMQAVGSSFTGVEHRIEPVRTLDGVQYFNDSIASSPTRTIAGLRSFDRKIILIAGGYDKKIPYGPLAPELIAHVKTLVLMGQTGPIIEAALRADPGFAGCDMQILHAATMQEAVEKARAAAAPGDIVSLSPASASFDMYPNFEVRGRDYKRIVKRAGMIRALAAPADRAAFAACIRPWPALRAVMGRDLTLWADNPGAPVKLFCLTAENGALTAVLDLYGRTALLCGTPDAAQREELAAFLRFTGTEKLRSPTPLPDWPAGEREPLFCCALTAGQGLPARRWPAGFTVDDVPPAAEMAGFLFPGDADRQDAYYVTTNAARSHALGAVWLLRDAQGAPASTVAATLYEGEAYLQMGYTAPAARGQGLFAALITHVANDLAGQGYRVTLDCAAPLCPLYERLGFTQIGILHQYNTNRII